eukprot:ANDGO_05835.mRNA.1 hypothetical protein
MSLSWSAVSTLFAREYMSVTALSSLSQGRCECVVSFADIAEYCKKKGEFSAAGAEAAFVKDAVAYWFEPVLQFAGGIARVTDTDVRFQWSTVSDVEDLAAMFLAGLNPRASQRIEFEKNLKCVHRGLQKSVRQKHPLIHQVMDRAAKAAAKEDGEGRRSAASPMQQCDLLLRLVSNCPFILSVQENNCVLCSACGVLLIVSDTPELPEDASELISASSEILDALDLDGSKLPFPGAAFVLHVSSNDAAPLKLLTLSDSEGSLVERCIAGVDRCIPELESRKDDIDDDDADVDLSNLRKPLHGAAAAPSAAKDPKNLQGSAKKSTEGPVVTIRVILVIVFVIFCARVAYQAWMQPGPILMEQSSSEEFADL